MCWLRSVAFWLLLCWPLSGILPAHADPIVAIQLPAAIKVRVILVGEETLCPGDTNFSGCAIRRADCELKSERECIDLFIDTDLAGNEQIEFELDSLVTHVDKSDEKLSSFFTAVADFNQHLIDNRFLAAVFVFDFPPPLPVAMTYRRVHPEYPRTINSTIETGRYVYWMNSLFIDDERTRLQFTFNGSFKTIVFK